MPPRFETDWAALSQDSDLAGRLAAMTILLEFTRESTGHLESSTLDLSETLRTEADL